MWNDRRLTEKYSLLKIPWKRSHTLPICNSRPSLTANQEYYNRIREYSDQKTYLYDDGSEVDSALCLEPPRRPYKYNQGTKPIEFIFKMNIQGACFRIRITNL